MNYCQRGVIMDLGMAFISISAFLMGFVVMWIGFFFISRELQFTAAEFGGFITSFFGGAVIAVYTTMLNPATQILFLVVSNRSCSWFVGLSPCTRQCEKIKLFRALILFSHFLTELWV